MIRYVTSMSKELYDKCGKEMLSTFDKYWPEGELLVYTEDLPIGLPEFNERIKDKGIYEVPGCKDFIANTKSFPIFSGIINGQRNYRFDIHHFARKAFAQIDAALNYKGYLFWIDCDVLTEKSIPASMIEKFIEGNFMCLMKRKTWHMCSSFVGWDCSHVFSSEWWKNYFDLYTSGKCFLFPEWHDAYLLEKIIDGIPGVIDLGKDITGEGPYNVFNDVFKGYAKHLKGNLK